MKTHEPIVVRIDRKSIKKNPDAGRTEYAVPGARCGRKTVVTEVGENFVVEEFILCGEGQWRSVRKNAIDSRFCLLKPGETVEIGQDIQHVHTITPEPSHLFEYVFPEVQCSECGKAEVINKWHSDWDDESGADWKTCPNCESALEVDVNYERISDALKEMA